MLFPNGSVVLVIRSIDFGWNTAIVPPVSARMFLPNLRQRASARSAIIDRSAAIEGGAHVDFDVGATFAPFGLEQGGARNIGPD